MQQLPDLNAAELNSQEHCQSSAPQPNKKRPLQSADAAEHTTAAKRPKSNVKKVQTKLTNVIKADTMVCVLCTPLFYK
jgi:hypothetical protein